MESHVRVDRARYRQKELGRRTRTLNDATDAQKKAADCSRSRIEDQIRVSYKGSDIEGLLLLVEGLFGGSEARDSALATSQALHLPTESSESILTYEDTQQNL